MHEESVLGIKKRYEEALKSAEEALATNIDATRNEVARLEESLRIANAHSLQNKNIQDLANVFVTQQYPLKKATESENEVASLKQSLQVAQHELSRLHHDHATIVNYFREHFNAFRTAQEALIVQLKSQLTDLVASEPGTNNASRNPVSEEQKSYGSAFPRHSGRHKPELGDFFEKYRKLEYQYKVKAAEMETVLRSLGNNSFSNSDHSQQSFAFSLSTEDVAVELPLLQPRPPMAGGSYNDQGFSILHPVHEDRHPSNEAHLELIDRDQKLREELWSSRLETAEAELESLRQQLASERRITADLQQQYDSNQMESAKQSIEPSSSKVEKMLPEGGISSGISQPREQPVTASDDTQQSSTLNRLQQLFTKLPPQLLSSSAGNTQGLPQFRVSNNSNSSVAAVHPPVAAPFSQQSNDLFSHQQAGLRPGYVFDPRSQQAKGKFEYNYFIYEFDP
jgi:sulfur relay (sulfurtransferase) DsrC/TusE family protein